MILLIIPNKENFIFISDLQIPFEHSKALQHCKYLKRHYRVPDENCYCVGDEIDAFWGGMYKKTPDALHTPTGEIKAAREHLKPWYDAFPELKIAESNHGTRWLRKALDAEIPSELLRKNKEMLDSPPGWVWKKHWKINSKFPMLAEHGDDYGGQTPHVAAASANGVSTILGHHHSLAGIEFIKTNGMDIWGAVIGCLIDFEAYAFEYARKYKRKPVLGALVVLWSGRFPIFVPIEGDTST